MFMPQDRFLQEEFGSTGMNIFKSLQNFISERLYQFPPLLFENVLLNLPLTELIIILKAVLIWKGKYGDFKIFYFVITRAAKVLTMFAKYSFSL